MALNLKKGQKIDLVKKGDVLGRVLVGLGWDPIKATGGFFKKLFSSAGADIDCDASVLMLEAGDKLTTKSDVVYFGNLRSAGDSIIHTGDNLTGEGDGDDEQILVDLNSIPQRITKLLFVVNIFSAATKNQHFGMIENCYIRLFDETNKKELVRFDMSEGNDGDTALIAASIEREDGGWKFAALGDATKDISLEKIVQRYER